MAETIGNVTAEMAEEIAQAMYCAAPDAVAYCEKLCSDVGVSGIGVRIGAYMQSLAFFVLVLLAPDEDGAQSVWVGLSVSYALLITAFVELFQGAISMHHCVIVFLLSMLPYIGTLAAFNSLTAYRGLGKLEIRFLQAGLIIKSVISSILWGLVLYGFFVGQLPESLPLSFRQPLCLDNTAVVVFFTALRSDDESQYRSKGLIIFYSVFWLIILVVGDYWTLRAPAVLRQHPQAATPNRSNLYDARGDPLVNEAAGPKTIKARKAELEKDPEAYRPSDSSDEQWLDMTLKSLPKGKGAGSGAKGSRSAGSAPRRGGGGMDSDVEDILKDDPWTAEQIKSRHVIFIWPAVAVLLVLNCCTVELQIALNEIFPGESEFDFPGTLSMLLALPTCWGVFTVIRKIRLGKKPKPSELPNENFFEEGKSGGQEKMRRRDSRRRGNRRVVVESSEDSDMGDDVPLWRVRRRGRDG